MTVRRKSAGSIIFLVSLLIGLILVVVLAGLGFNYMLVMRSQAQYTADALALSMASKLNNGDRIGEINQMQVASRELIYVSRQSLYDAEATGNKELISLCDRLVGDARSANKLVENERQNQIKMTIQEIQNAALDYNRQRKNDITFSFFGLKTFTPKIVRVDVGQIKNINSNVRAFDSLPDLIRFDLSRSYFDRGSKLFKADIDAKLPDTDSDLSFNLTALPAYIGKTASAARNTNEFVFSRYATIFDNGKASDSLPRQIPSAVQIHLSMESVLPWDQSKTMPLTLIATGSTSGATIDSK